MFSPIFQVVICKQSDTVWGKPGNEAAAHVKTKLPPKSDL